MAALTGSVDRSASYPGQGYRAELYSDTNDTYYKGAIVVFQANGHIKVASDVNAEVVAGVVAEETVVTGGAGRVPVLCRSRVWFRTTTALSGEADIGDLYRATSDNDLAGAAANKENVGRVVGVRNDINEVLLDMAWVA